MPNRVTDNVGRNDDCLRYLYALFGSAPAATFVELRFRTDSGMGRAFYDARRIDAVTDAITRRAAKTDVYVGVVPRARQASCREDLATTASVLWVDCDSNESVAALADFLPAPNVVVMSGSNSNCHAYWLLREPTGLDAIQAANRNIAISVGADVVCADATRVLRPPSRNHKHVPPTDVRLLRCDESRTSDDPLLHVAPAVYVERLVGLVASRSGKVACPFHADDTPSMHVYSTPARGWYCYGCRRGGSIYDLASALWGLSTRGAEFSELRARLDTLFDHTDVVSVGAEHS